MPDADQIQAAAPPPDNSISSVPDTPPALDVAPVEPPPASDAAPAGTEAPGDSSSAPGAEVLDYEKSVLPTGAAAPETQESQPADAEPPADAPLVRATAPTAEEIAASTLIEVPVQGAALEREQPIPPPDAQPLIGVDQIQAESAALVDAVMAAKGSEGAANAAAIEGHSTESNVVDVMYTDIGNHEEHPLDTIDRIRTKLAAYGEECLKTVQHEIEYLISLVDDDRPAKP